MSKRGLLQTCYFSLIADTDQNGNYYIVFSEVGTLESVYFYFRMGAAADGYREFNILAQGKGVDCTEELQIINIQLEPI